MPQHALHRERSTTQQIRRGEYGQSQELAYGTSSRFEEVQRVNTSDIPTSRASGSGEHNVVIAYEAPQADMNMQRRTYSSGSANVLSVPPTYVGPFVANMMQRAGTALTQVYGRHPSVGGNGSYAPGYAPGTRGRIQGAGLARPPASNGGGSAEGAKRRSNAGKAIDREGFQHGEAYQRGRKRRLDPSKGHEEQGAATTSTSPSKRRRTSPPAAEPSSHSGTVQVIHGPCPAGARIPGAVGVDLPASASNAKRTREDDDCEELYTPRHDSSDATQVLEQQPRPSKRLREDAGEQADVGGTKITGNNTALSQESLTQLTNLGHGAEPAEDWNEPLQLEATTASGTRESATVEEDTLGMDHPFQTNPLPNIRDHKRWVQWPPRKETSVRSDPEFEFLPSTWDALGFGYYEFDPDERLLASSIPLY